MVSEKNKVRFIYRIFLSPGGLGVGQSVRPMVETQQIDETDRQARRMIKLQFDHNRQFIK